MKITFTKSAIPYLLELFDKQVSSGLIIESDTKEPVLTARGETLNANELGAIVKGSEIFYKADITSVINLLEDTQD